MPKRRATSMNEEILEYLKFLHLHNLVNIIVIIESIPIYYQTQIKRFSLKDLIETVDHQKMRMQNLTNSTVFNNAVSSRKQFAKRYRISEYNKQYLIDMFKGEENYRNFLELVENKDLFFLKDISLAILFHNHYSNGSTSKKSKLYKQNDIN